MELKIHKGFLVHTILQLSKELHISNLSILLSHFILKQQQSADSSCDNPDNSNYPWHDGKIHVFNSASTLFYAPSDVSGICWMQHEFIHSTPLWRNEAPHYDCVFVNINPDMELMNSLEVAQVLGFFSFHFKAYTTHVLWCTGLIKLETSLTRIQGCGWCTHSSISSANGG